MSDGKRVFIEQKLIDAAEELASFVEHDHLSPDSALEKVATEQNLKPGEITLVARAYNVAQTNDLRETGRSLLEKAGEFAAANADVVCNKLFPKDRQKAAAALRIPQRSDSVSLDYYWNPEKVIKAAAIACEEPKPVVKYAHLTQKPAEPVLSEYTKATLSKLAADRFKAATHAWFDFHMRKTRELDQAIQNAVQYIGSPKAPSVASLQKAAKAFRGQNAVLALDVVLAANPRISLYKKQASVVSDTEPALNLLDKITQKTHEKQAAYEMCVVVEAGLHELSKLNQYYKTAKVEMTRPHNKFAKLLPDLGGWAQIVDTVNNTFSLPNVLQAAEKYKSEAKGWSPDPLVEEKLQAIDTPTHSANLRRLAVAANLHNVLTSDPHLRGYDPKTVAKAFNQLVQLNPQLLHKDLPVRMALRRQLAQDGLELFEQEQLTKFDDHNHE